MPCISGCRPISIDHKAKIRPMKRSFITVMLLSSVLLTACSSGPEKAPKCKGRYTSINAPERYLSPTVKEDAP